MERKAGGKIVYVVLAAGGARRMGFAKATTPLAGVAPVARLAATLEGRDLAVVTSTAQRDACAREVPGARIFVNPSPERGMTSSLSVAHAALDPEATLGVLLADKPLVSRRTLERCEHALGSCDVLYATVLGEPGHPVYFAPAARARLRDVPDGDTLRVLRDHPDLRRADVACDEDPGVVIDLDTPQAWDAAERQLLEQHARTLRTNSYQA
jgi:CTP:molybdopterin cytidylyltransferase MocA